MLTKEIVTDVKENLQLDKFDIVVTDNKNSVKERIQAMEDKIKNVKEKAENEDKRVETQEQTSKLNNCLGKKRTVTNSGQKTTSKLITLKKDLLDVSTLHLIKVTPTKITKNKRKENELIENRSSENKLNCQMQVNKMIEHFSSKPAPFPLLPKKSPICQVKVLFSATRGLRSEKKGQEFGLANSERNMKPDPKNETNE